MALVGEANRRNKAYALAVLLFSGLTSFQSLASSVRVTDITDEQRVTHIIAEFKDGLTRKGFDSHITACDHVVEYVVQSTSGHDYSYGASCTVADGTTFMMCNDILIGKFTLNKVENSTREKLKEFIHNNCPPGG